MFKYILMISRTCSLKKIPFVKHDRSSEVFVVGVDLLAQLVDELEIRDKN